MVTLNLVTKTNDDKIIKDYLEANASDVLAEKINNGTPFEKDGKKLLNKKTLENFMKFACGEAKKLAEQGVMGAFVDNDVVYGWAFHYFEEDDLEGTLYNEDGTEYKPYVLPTPKYEPKPVEPPKPQLKNVSMFDLVNNAKLAELDNEIAELNAPEIELEVAV